MAKAKGTAILGRVRFLHDRGRLDTTVEPPDAEPVELSDFALPSPEMCRIVGGSLAETLRIVALAAPQALELGCRLDGAPSCAGRCHFSVDEGLATQK